MKTEFDKNYVGAYLDPNVGKIFAQNTTKIIAIASMLYTSGVHVGFRVVVFRVRGYRLGS